MKSRQGGKTSRARSPALMVRERKKETDSNLCDRRTEMHTARQTAVRQRNINQRERLRLLPWRSIEKAKKYKDRFYRKEYRRPAPFCARGDVRSTERAEARDMS